VSAADRDATLKVGSGDTATAETTLPFSVAEIRTFLSDIPRLVRLNPQLAIERWVPAEWGFRFAGRNESNDRAFDLGVLVDRAGDGLILRYDTGLKQATELAVAPAEEGARLVVTEYYPRIEDPQDPRVAEVDKSLVPWVAAIRRHLLARRRWSWLPGWQWWTERFMLSMVPRSRRIVRLLVWTTIAEFAVFLGLVVVLRFMA
jgi:hypothetical protein